MSNFKRNALFSRLTWSASRKQHVHSIMILFTRARTEAAQKSQLWTVFASIFQFQLTCRRVEVLAILISLCSDSRRPARVNLLYVDKIQSFNEKIKKKFINSHGGSSMTLPPCRLCCSHSGPFRSLNLKAEYSVGVLFQTFSFY